MHTFKEKENKYVYTTRMFLLLFALGKKTQRVRERETNGYEYLFVNVDDACYIFSSLTRSSQPRTTFVLRIIG